VQSSRIKEILAQGARKMQDKTAEQEREETKRKLPYHLHINVDLVKYSYLTAAMLIEVPLGVSQKITSTKRVVSKPYKKLVDQYEKNCLESPPEYNEDYIFRASR
jgi:translation initiation factor 3 subunit C